MHRWQTYKDDWTWQQHVHRVEANWELSLPEPTSAYLKWKYPLPAASPNSPCTLDTPININFNINVVNIYSLDTQAYILHATDSRSLSEALVLQGFLGNAPLNLSIAVSIKTLELYWRIRLRKPLFSVEAFAKVICDLYSVMYSLFGNWHALIHCRFCTSNVTRPHSATYSTSTWPYSIR
jgi:hypothetical protein